MEEENVHRSDVYYMCIVINCLKMTQWQKFQHQQRLKCSSHSWQEKLQLYSSGCHNKGKIATTQDCSNPTGSGTNAK